MGAGGTRGGAGSIRMAQEAEQPEDNPGACADGEDRRRLTAERSVSAHELLVTPLEGLDRAAQPHSPYSLPDLLPQHPGKQEASPSQSSGQNPGLCSPAHVYHPVFQQIL